MRILFLFLKGFSFTGGIEKFNRCLMKALHELYVEEKITASAISSYDKLPDERYFLKKSFAGWNGMKSLFVSDSFVKGIGSDIIIIGHINLALVGYLIKLIKPSTKIILIAHGIEVWRELGSFKKKLLNKVDRVLAVSSYTRERLLHLNPVLDADKVHVFPNTIDPYFSKPISFEKPAYLIERYNILPDVKVLLTITRLSATEKYKGYDRILEAMARLVQDNNIKYILAGKADPVELERIQSLIKNYQLEDKVLLTGFVDEKELIDHYLLADVFIMPSKKEGFGIVFIEALMCGKKVIAGSKDGSVDALLGGKLGMLVDPDDATAIQQAINSTIQSPPPHARKLQEQTYQAFGFPSFKMRLENHLFDLHNAEK